MISPRFLRQFAVSFMALLVAVALFIAIVNPYGVSPIRMTIRGFNAMKPKRVDIDRQIKPFEVWRTQPKTIFLGTSRIHQAIDPAIMDGTRFAPAYNASIPANTLGMNISHLERYIALDPALKTVIIELFVYNFLSQQQSPITVGSLEHLTAVVPLMLSANAAWGASETLAHNVLRRPPLRQINERGYFMYPPGHDARATFNGFPNGIWTLHPKPPARSELHESAFASLQQIADIAGQHRLELIVMATPNHAFMDYYFDAVGLWPLIEQWLTRAAAIATVYSFSQPNAWVYEPVREGMTYWNDPTHVSLQFGRAMTAALAGLGVPGAPANLMVHLTPERVPTHIEERKRAIQIWAKENREFVDDFNFVFGIAGINRAVPIGKVETGTLVIDAQSYEIVERIGGSLERQQEARGGLRVYGWAADHKNDKPAVAIVAAVGHEIVARTVPSGARADIEAGIGRGVRPAEFQLTIPLPPDVGGSPANVRLYALTHDGKAVRLASSLPAGQRVRIEPMPFPTK